MDYLLESLGDDRFQQLSQALLVREFPRVQCFPLNQADGGRDATRRTSTGDSPFSVFQVKYTKRPLEVDAYRALSAVARKEQEKVSRLKRRGASEYFLITNIPGTGSLDVGTIDRISRELRTALNLPVTIWWRDDIERRLDASGSIRLHYPELLTGRDAFQIISYATREEDRERRANALNAFLANQYAEDFEVKFKQVDLRSRLLDVFIDLPFTLTVEDFDEAPLVRALETRLVIERSQSGLVTIATRPDSEPLVGTASIFLDARATTAVRSVLIEGAPGQGKSTLAQYLCQVHRIRLLDKRNDLRFLPEHHRLAPLQLPIKVDLRDLAKWFDSRSTPSAVSAIGPDLLEPYLASLIEYKSGNIAFSSNDLAEVSKSIEVLLVLDGLDEIAEVGRRSRVVNAIISAIPRMRQHCPGMHLVVTSRPTLSGSAHGFQNSGFSFLRLGAVTRPQIVQYTAKWANVRKLSEAEQKEITRTLEEKLELAHIRELAKNPMQLAILLQLIHVRGAALPEKRTHLYDAYVDHFFVREAEKSDVVKAHRDLLIDIHRYLAWVLHVAAEAGGEGRLTTDALSVMLRRYLEHEQQSTAVVSDIFDAMLDRVVMLVSRVQGTYEFEVQPLREYFAARFLYDTAPYSPVGGERSGTKPDRFEAIARNPYWINVTRFFAGCYSKGELADLAYRLKRLLSDGAFASVSFPARVSAMLLSDWVFQQSPHAQVEVVMALCEDTHLTKLLPRHTVAPSEDAVLFTEDCGRAAVVQRVRFLLEDPKIGDDWAFRLAGFLRSNGTNAENKSWWVASATERRFPSVARTLRLWRLLYSTGWRDDDEIRASGASIKYDDLDDAAILELLVGEFPAPNVLQDVRYQSRALDLFLDDTAHLALALHPGMPLFLLPLFLESWNHLFSRRLDKRMLREQVEAFRSELSRVSNDLQDGTPPWTALDFSLEMARALDAGGGELGTIQSASLLDRAVKTWGLRPRLFLAGLTMARANVASPEAEEADKLDLTLVGRLETARRARADTQWWLTQWQLCRGAREIIREFQMMFWTIATDEVLIDARCHEITEALELLDDKSFVWQINVVWGSSIGDVISRGDLSPLTGRNITGARARLLLGVQAPRLDVELSSYDIVVPADARKTIAQAKQRAALTHAGRNAMSWADLVDVVLATCRDGATWGYSQSGRDATVPGPVAARVVASPWSYPANFWDTCVASVEASLPSFVRRVAVTAREEGWFEPADLYGL